MGEVDATRARVDREQAELAELGGVVARDPDRELRARVAPLDVPVGEPSRRRGPACPRRRPASRRGPACRDRGPRSAPSSASRTVPSHQAAVSRPGPTVGRHIAPSPAARSVSSVRSRTAVRGLPSTTRLTSSRPPIQPASCAVVVAGDRLGAPVPDAPDVDVGAGGAVGGPGGEREARPVRRVAGGGADDHDVARDLDGAVGPGRDLDAGRRLGGPAASGARSLGRRRLGRRAAPSASGVADSAGVDEASLASGPADSPGVAAGDSDARRAVDSGPPDAGADSAGVVGGRRRLAPAAVEVSGPRARGGRAPVGVGVASGVARRSRSRPRCFSGRT